MKKENKSFLKECIIIIIVGIIVNAACIIFSSFSSKAAGYESEYFPIESGYNPGNYPIDNSLIMSYFDDPTVCMVHVVWENSVSHPDWYSIYILRDSSVTSSTPFNLYGEVYSSNPARFDVRTVGNVSSISVQQDQYKDGFLEENIYTWTGQFAFFSNIPSTVSDNMDIYYSKENLNKDTLNGMTLIFGNVKNAISVGDFTELPPLDDILNNITNSFNPHSNDTPPTYDNNLSDGQNISNAINGHSQNMNNAINNLGNNIKDWFDNLQDKLTRGFNSVSQNIFNGFKTLMDNIKDFFGAKLDYIIDKFNYITKPFDSSELANDLNNSTFASSALGLIVSVQSFSESFLSGSEPNSCTFTLDFTNAFYNFGVCTFSLDWLLPIRPIIRLFLGGLCLYSLAVSIFTSLNTYIGGTSSINDDI